MHLPTPNKRVVAIATAIALVVLAAVFGSSPASATQSPKCATIQGGTIVDSMGNPISTGYDEFGYNYQSHQFNGTYDSSDRVLDGKYWGATGDYVDDQLIMKWSNDWLANVDCDHDGTLDRGFDTDTPGISRGWLTNHVGSVGPEPHTEYFAKIVWVGPGGDLWGQYTIIQEVWNDPANGDTGLSTKVGTPGFGLNDHWTTN